MSYRRVFTTLVFIALIAFVAVNIRSTQADSSNTDSSAIDVFADNPQQAVASGFDFSSIDRSVSACQDFDQFASGGWKAKNPVPGAYSVWGRFTQLDEQNQNVLHGILDGLLAKKRFANANEQKIADFYNSCMDEQAIEGQGIKPLQPELD